MSVLENLGVATRAHLQKTNNLGGNRNANRVLSQMERDKTIKSIRMDQKIYYAPHKDIKTNDRSQLIHMLMRSDMYLYWGQPKSWDNEYAIEFPYKNEEVTLRSDALFKKQGEFHFLEVDHKRDMKANREKINKYKALAPLMFEQYNHTPTLVWYTVSERRRELLKGICEKKGVKCIVLSINDLS